MSNGSTLSLPEIERRIAIVRDNIRQLIEQAAAKKKLKLDVKLEADSFRVLTSLVEEGLGYALLPPSSVRTTTTGFSPRTVRLKSPGVGTSASSAT